MRNLKISLLTLVAVLFINTVNAQKMSEPQNVTFATVVNKSAKDVWFELSKIKGLEEIIPSVLSKTYIEGNGKAVEGAIRACTSPDGHKFREKIVILDKKNMYYTYEVLEGVPAKMKNTFRVVPLGEGISKVVWESNYSFIENPMMKENQFFAFINMNGQKIVNEVAAYFNL